MTMESMRLNTMSASGYWGTSEGKLVGRALLRVGSDAASSTGADAASAGGDATSSAPPQPVSAQTSAAPTAHEIHLLEIMALPPH